MGYRLDHVHIVCRDLEEMIGFFTTHFGADLSARKKFGGADGAVLDLGGSTVNLRCAQDGEELVPGGGRRTFGYHHLGIGVDDVDAEFERLSAAGFAFHVEPRDAGDARIAFFTGPDGIVVEILQSR